MSESSHTVGKVVFDRLPPDAVAAFVADFGGTVVTPDHHVYDEARSIWNAMIDRYPALVAQCTGAEDVVAAVAFAREHELELAVRGGGHNVAGTAICDGGLVVDLTSLTDVVVDPAAKRVRVEGGATLGDVDRETTRHGLVTPLGVVSATGVAGLTLNGGLGHLRREYGLACDGLESVEIVTADGTVRTASESENSDLFWAVRGGGGNFGVVTSFEFHLHPIDDVFGLFVWYQGRDAPMAFEAFHEFVRTAPREASVLPFVAHVPELAEFPESAWGEPAVAFLGCYDGPEAIAEATFRSLREVATPIADFSAQMAYTDLQTMLDEDYPDGLRYYWKSVYVPELTAEVVEVVVRRGVRAPSTLSTVDVWHLGGAITDVAPDATAFWHRQQPFMVTVEANWEDAAADGVNVAWARATVEELRAIEGVGGSYGNFPGLLEDPATTLFGENYDRLVAVKTKYDPENVFQGNQNVRPGVGTPAAD
ncbi:FAD-binding oxidoreductase [Haloarchaeobius sp. DFWS5]|uniref:FAD-binding oxidoreductase n=1 Tax=Haloarchaeobius sp. DFWS5 TaxID=3446114 RepID=UPI003EB720A9